MCSGLVPAAVVALGVFTCFLTLRAARAGADAAARHKKSDNEEADTKKTPALPATCPLEHVVHFVSAFGFGWGLCLSGMTTAGKVRGFLDFSGPAGWDPSLMGVMAGAVGFNLLSFRLLRRDET